MADQRQMKKTSAKEAMEKIEKPPELIECLDEIEQSSSSYPEKSTRVIVFHRDTKPVAYRSHFEYFVERRLLKENEFIIHIEIRFSNPVFGPPGVMAVTKVDRNGHEILLSKYLGSLNPRDCYPLFRQNMVEFYKFITEKEEYKNAPWIIHTMDYFKQGGLRVYEDVITIFQPTAVVQLDAYDDEMAQDLQNSGDGNFQLIRFHALAHEEYYKSIHENMCLVNDWEGGHGRVRRTRKFEKYFKGATIKTVSLDTCGIGSMGYVSNFWPLLNRMNNKLVAVCKFPPSTSFLGNAPKKWIRKAKQLSNKFIGYGIVRSIHSETCEIELITPVSQDILDEKDTFLVTAEDVRFDEELCMSILRNAVELVE